MVVRATSAAISDYCAVLLEHVGEVERKFTTTQTELDEKLNKLNVQYVAYTESLKINHKFVL